MSRLTRSAAVLLTALVVLSVTTPAVLASSPPTISVDQGDTTYTVTVTHNGTPVNDSTVNVTADDPNSTYSAGPALTDGNGTVTFDLPENETAVTVTATFNGSTYNTSATLQAANESEDGNDRFGLRVSMFVHNLITDPGNNTILGQTISEWVTANNPGSEHRSDKANPGGNSTGPPEHAGTNSDNGQGPPDHAKNASDDKGNNSAKGNGSSSNAGGEDGGDGDEDDTEESLARPIGL